MATVPSRCDGGSASTERSCCQPTSLKSPSNSRLCLTAACGLKATADWPSDHGRFAGPWRRRDDAPRYLPVAISFRLSLRGRSPTCAVPRRTRVSHVYASPYLKAVLAAPTATTSPIISCSIPNSAPNKITVTCRRRSPQPASARSWTSCPTIWRRRRRQPALARRTRMGPRIRPRRLVRHRLGLGQSLFA